MASSEVSLYIKNLFTLNFSLETAWIFWWEYRINIFCSLTVCRKKIWYEPNRVQNHEWIDGSTVHVFILFHGAAQIDRLGDVLVCCACVNILSRSNIHLIRLYRTIISIRKPLPRTIQTNFLPLSRSIILLSGSKRLRAVPHYKQKRNVYV